MVLVPKKSKREINREFGLLMALVFSIISGFLAWKGSSTLFYLLPIALIFYLLAKLAPMALDPLERVWMKFAEVLSVVMTTLILTLLFSFVITPIGLIMRLFGKDPMCRKIELERDSYWEPMEGEGGPLSRPYLPY